MKASGGIPSLAPVVAAGNFLRNPADARDTHVNKNTAPNDEFVLKYRKPQGNNNVDRSMY